MNLQSVLPMSRKFSRPALIAWATLIFLIGGPPARGGEETVIAGVTHVRNGTTPAEGTSTWRLKEIWRAGGDDDEILCVPSARLRSVDFWVFSRICG